MVRAIAGTTPELALGKPRRTNAPFGLKRNVQSFIHRTVRPIWKTKGRQQLARTDLARLSTQLETEQPARSTDRWRAVLIEVKCQGHVLSRGDLLPLFAFAAPRAAAFFRPTR